MSQILVPIDFSENSIHAYRFALDAASKSDGTVHLLHVVELPVVSNTVFTPVRALGMPMRRDIREKTFLQFNKISKKYNQRIPEIFKLEVGVPSRSILSYSKQNDIDLIVMGSHGRLGLRDVFVGSNTEKVVRTSPVPVIVVRNFHQGPVSNIVFPCGLEQEDQRDLVRKLKVLQSFFEATLHIVWINTPAKFTEDVVTLKRLKTFVSQHGIKDYTLTTFNSLFEEEGIMTFADHIKADMIAMGTHGRKGLSRMMYGSKIERVAKYGRNLLWTYRIK